MSGPSSPSIDTAAIGSAQAAAARALATGVNPREIFVPRPSATAAQLTAAAEDGYVTPLYQSTPAPVGLAEYGLKADPAGHLQPFVLNTTSVRATFDPSADGGPNATYLLDSTPDGYGVQLNAVVTNITLFDHDGYEFWTQNVMEFFPYTGAMLLTTNVWNWSSSSEYLSPNVFYAHGPNGTQEGSTFYVSSVGPLRISYPFNLTLTMVSNVTGGRDSVYFSANVTSPSGDYNRPDYDYVIFNSLGTDAPGLTTPSNYSADGFGYNPIGGTNDFELTIGGPGSGSQTTLLTSNASESLDYWNASTGSYHAIPSAYTYGDETGETSIGAAMSWATRPDGSPYGIMTTGPSLLGGLWNASSPSGGPGHLQVVVRPSNAFVFIADKDSLQSPFNVSAPEWAPTVNTDSFTLPSGVYQIFLAESDYNERSVTEVAVTAGSSARVTEDLTWNSSEGVYTPLWAWTNAQIANLSTSGNGTQANPYQIVNQQNSPILEPFGALNDLGFPVFPGVYFLHTTAYTEFVDPPSLTAHVSTNSGHTFPTYNDLPWWFYEDANVAITGAQNVSGWFAATASDYPADSIAQYLAFNVIVLNSSGFLIAHDDFQTEARGLLLSGGTDNVVWGNTFLQLNPPSPSSYLAPFSEGMAVVVLETGDLVYNNLFSNSPITAASGSAELYFHHPVAYTDTWNITPQSASEVHRASNWPAYALTGSVIGGTIQGGNFWWDYGMKGSEWFHSNPYGVL
ncbi:MAG: thermopsin family protease, partial [Thermoplasmata archaeon]